MAPNTTNRHPGRAASAIHWLFPSRWQLAIGVTADLGLTLFGCGAGSDCDHVSALSPVWPIVEEEVAMSTGDRHTKPQRAAS